MSKHRYTATFKRKDETVFTKTFLASDLFEADEYALQYVTKRGDLYLDLGPAEQKEEWHLEFINFKCFFCYFLVSFTNRYIVENRRYIK